MYLDIGYLSFSLFLLFLNTLKCNIFFINEIMSRYIQYFSNQVYYLRNFFNRIFSILYKFRKYNGLLVAFPSLILSS